MQKQAKMPLKLMIPQILDGLRELGYPEATLWRSQYHSLRHIHRFFEARGEDSYDEKILGEYMEEIKRQYDCKQITRQRYSERRRAAERFSDFYHTGVVRFLVRPKGTSFVLPPKYEAIVQDFASQTSYTENTKGDVLWTIRKYLCFADGKGIKKLSDLTLANVQDFLVQCSSRMKGGSLSNMRGYIYKFHTYLNECGECHFSGQGISTIPIVRETRIAPYLTQEELGSILMQINRLTDLGKRNYAIIVLAIHTGMRAHDIACLKLSDIDWRNGIIKMTQQKTQTNVSLPLTAAVGEAIREYILDSRPSSGSEYVFLRANAPWQPFKNGIAIQNMFNDYQKKAGIKREAFDGKGFHAIRRAVGRNMAAEGVVVTTISQVLGHVSTDAVKQYIALDTAMLKECALSLDGIEPKGVSR